jgi:hypothetical protein
MPDENMTLLSIVVELLFLVCKLTVARTEQPNRPVVVVNCHNEKRLWKKNLPEAD